MEGQDRQVVLRKDMPEMPGVGGRYERVLALKYNHVREICPLASQREEFRTELTKRLSEKLDGLELYDIIVEPAAMLKIDVEVVYSIRDSADCCTKLIANTTQALEDSAVKACENVEGNSHLPRYFELRGIELTERRKYEERTRKRRENREIEATAVYAM